jgi:hypothetical protein
MLFSAFAQSNATVTIKGILIDSATNKVESFATVQIANKNTPNTPIKIGTTDINGKFNEKINGYGNFIATVSMIGKTTITKEFSITATDNIIDLGTLYIFLLMIE